MQSGSAVSAWLTTPALTKEGQRIAFFQLNVVPLPDCASTFCQTTPYDTAFTQPDLVSGVLRVRNILGTEADIATLNVRFLGRDFDETRPPPGVLGLTILENFPFQRRFVEQRLPAFRPPHLELPRPWMRKREIHVIGARGRRHERRRCD